MFVKEAASRLDPANPPREPKLPWAAMPSPAFEAIMSLGRGNWGYWIVDTVEAEEWYDGGIGLIGDAAHAMLPFQAQGAAMAIEDAAILAPLLMTEPDAGDAFRRYAAMRQPRVERVRRVSNSNGFAFHLEWPFSLGRNAVLRAEGPRGHLKRLDWLYSFDAAPEAAIPPPDRQGNPARP
jgi:salicylate hydroxylase